jgi:excisionase family DNA binding protein
MPSTTDHDLFVAVDRLLLAIDQRIEQQIARRMPDVIPTGEWLTVRQVAAKYDLSTSEIRSLAREGRISAVKSGHGRGTWRFRASELPDTPPSDYSATPPD